jgi:hypothetical protein
MVFLLGQMSGTGQVPLCWNLQLDMALDVYPMSLGERQGERGFVQLLSPAELAYNEKVAVDFAHDCHHFKVGPTA